MPLSAGAVAASLEEVDTATVKPFHSSVVDEVGGAFYGAVGEIAACSHICLIGVLIAAEDAVVEDMGVAVGEERLRLSHIAAGIADGEVFGIEAAGIDIEGGAVVVGIVLIAFSAAYARGKDGGLLVFADEREVFVLRALPSCIDVLLIHSRTDVYDAARTFGNGIDGILYLGVVAGAVLCHGGYHHGGVVVGSGGLTAFTAASAEVGEGAHVGHGMVCGILCLFGGYLTTENLYLVYAWRLHLGVGVERGGERTFAVGIHLHGILEVFAVPHSPAERHIGGVDYVFHEIALVGEDGPSHLVFL